MGKIRKLSDDLANKIAAGEVVERPASVVKELLENSIDAKSNVIEVFLWEGGLKSIRIVDNGIGMSEEDAILSLERHATSKIYTVHDLFRIQSLGFRGEAIPSIASVSEFEMITSTGEGAGTRLVVNGGMISKQERTHGRKGTDITIQNLFYNTPARLKYMKTVQTELGNILDHIQKLALAYANIAFKVYHNDKKIFHTSGNGNVLHVLALLFGRESVKLMKEISFEGKDFKLQGFIGPPSFTRSSRNSIFIAINQRVIRNHGIQRAIMQGYETQLMKGRFPVVYLNITIDPILVDVNVHPTKQEVRLSKETQIGEEIQGLIQSALKETKYIPSGFQSVIKDAPIPKEKLVQEEIVFSNHKETFVVKSTQSNQDSFPVSSTNDVDLTPSKPLNISANHENKKEQHRINPLYPIGQIHGTYIVAQNEEGAFLIDQHAAQERLHYDYFKKKLIQGRVDLQELLMPMTIEVTPPEMLMVDEISPVLQKIGIDLEPFGERTLIVRSHPTYFPHGLEKEIIEQLITIAFTSKNISEEKIRDEAIIMMSCKAAIKANQSLNDKEIFTLLENLRKSDSPYTCPHGRPILIHFSKNDLEKMFKRQV